MPESSKERILRYLNDAHAANQGEIASLEDAANQSLDDQVVAALQSHLKTAQSHRALLEERIEALGGKIAGAKGMLNTVIAKGSNFVNAFHDEQDKQTQDLVKLFALEQFGAAMYTSLQVFCQTVGDQETAQIAETLLRDEEQAAELFQGLIPRLALASANRTSDVTVNLAP